MSRGAKNRRVELVKVQQPINSLLPGSAGGILNAGLALGWWYVVIRRRFLAVREASCVFFVVPCTLNPFNQETS